MIGRGRSLRLPRGSLDRFAAATDIFPGLMIITGVIS
jgi:hypothetical protein